MSGRITDYHQFEIWRHEDNAVDIHCRRDEYDVDPETAVLEAEVVARSLGESIQDANELFRIKIYDNGLSTTMSRDSVAGDKWGRFRWVKERTNSALYSGVIGLPKPPEWFMRGLWAAEFAASMGMLAWGKMRGTWVQSGELVSDLQHESAETPEPLPQEEGNVIQWPGKRAT